MPAYAKDGKVVCYFDVEDEYMSFGSLSDANLSRGEGAPHPLIESSWLFTELDDTTEDALSAIVRRAGS